MGLSFDAKLPELYNNLAIACFSFGLRSKDPSLISQCLEYYKKAIELDPEYASPYLGLGYVYKQTGNLEGAIYCWERALEADPCFTKSLFELAEAYLDTGGKSKAFDMLRDYKKRCYHLMSPAERIILDALLEGSQK
jgi:tetratricopeptide (TPR) repeat protein